MTKLKKNQIVTLPEAQVLKQLTTFFLLSRFSKNLIVRRRKTIVTNLNNTNCDKTEIVRSKKPTTQIVTELNNSNCDKTKKNLDSDKT